MPINVPLSWLREYVDLPMPPTELAARLTLAGIEVEKLRQVGSEWDKIVVGRVTRLERHPNADRLWITGVEYGADAPQQIVTGAQNLFLDAKVPLALPGAVVLNGHSDTHEKITIKAGKLRGVDSVGMLCSALELGISADAEGILILADDAPLGEPLQAVLGDTILEIATTPNLGRILSMVGVAREVAALFGGTVRHPATDWQAEGSPIAGQLDVEIADPDLCSRYSAAVIRGIQIGPAPDWMQQRLTQAGMRPINNVVDITNYVMLEMGQPLHAFDYGKVHDQRIIVRRAQAGEQIMTLDHETRTLDTRTLVIADSHVPVALAGVMGGADSEVGDTTRDILLESANFDPLNVRRTARLLHLPSEAAYRYERSVDQQLTIPAMRRAAELMRQYAGGTIAEGWVDCFPAPRPERVISLTPHEVERLLGIQVAADEIAAMLRRLEFVVEVPAGAEENPLLPLAVRVPSYRNDVTIPADLVEEVARMIGYDTIPETLLDGALPPQAVNYDVLNREIVRDTLNACGLDEVITYSPISSAALARLGSPTPPAAAVSESTSDAAPVGKGRPAPARTWAYRAYDPTQPPLTIANPLSSEQDTMRPTLLPGLLGALRTNLRNHPRVALFEIGSTFRWAGAAEIAARQAAAAAGERPPLVPGEAEMPVEPRRVAGVLTGPRTPQTRFVRADAAGEQLDFFDAKGVLDTLFAHLHVTAVRYEPVVAPWYHPGRVAAVVLGDALLGVVGELHPQVAAAWELEGRRIYSFDLDLDALLLAMPPRERYSPISRYPAVTQDLALVVPDTVPAARVEALLRETGGKLLTDLTLFDLYTGAPVPAGHRSLAYALTFQALDRTLSDDDVTKLRTKLLGRVQRELGATLRT